MLSALSDWSLVQRHQSVVIECSLVHRKMVRLVWCVVWRSCVYKAVKVKGKGLDIYRRNRFRKSYFFFLVWIYKKPFFKILGVITLFCGNQKFEIPKKDYIGRKRETGVGLVSIKMLTLCQKSYIVSKLYNYCFYLRRVRVNL